MGHSETTTTIEEVVDDLVKRVASRKFLLIAAPERSATGPSGPLNEGTLNVIENATDVQRELGGAPFVLHTTTPGARETAKALMGGLGRAVQEVPDVNEFLMEIQRMAILNAPRTAGIAPMRRGGLMIPDDIMVEVMGRLVYSTFGETGPLLHPKAVLAVVGSSLFCHLMAWQLCYHFGHNVKSIEFEIRLWPMEAFLIDETSIKRLPEVKRPQ